MNNDIPAGPAAVRTGRLRRLLGPTFISLRNRNFKLYFIGQLVSNTGSWLTNVALVLLVLHITGSGVAVGTIMALSSLPLVALSAWGGAVADRVDKRRALLLTQSLLILESAGLAVIAFLPHPSVIALYTLSLWGGVVSAFDNPIRRAFIREMVLPEDLPNAVVLYSVVFNVSRILGPALAGLLVITVGYAWCFAIDAATFLAVLYCLYLMRPEELHRSPPARQAKGAVRAGLLYVTTVPSLWISFVMLAAIYLLSYNFSTTLPLFVTRSLHSSAGAYTLLYSTFSAGAVVSGLVVARRGMVRLRHIILGAFALGATTLLLAFTPGMLLAVPAAFLVGASAIVLLTSSTAIVQVEGRHDMCGRVLALQTVIAGGTGIIGPPFLGWVADTAGGRMPLIIGGTAALAAAAFGYFASRRQKRAAVRG
jgi:MFS family permease